MKKKQYFVLFVLLLSVRGLFSQTMTLEQCKQMALDNNSAIQIKQIHLKQAGHIKKSAFTQFLPSFGLSGAYIRMNKEFQLFEGDLAIPVLSHEFYDPATGNINSNLLYDPALMPNAFVMNPSTGLPATDVNENPIFLQYAWLPADQLSFGQKNNYLLNFGVIQPIYAGGKIRHLYKMSQALEQMAVHSLTAEQEKELMEIEELYWSLISVREQLKLAETYKQLLEKLIADIVNYQTEGIVLSNDLLKAQIKLNEAELNIMKAENGMKLIRKSLCYKIGLPLDRFFVPADTTIPVNYVFYTPEEIAASAVQKRTEMKMLEQTVLMTESGIKMMKSRFLPDIGFTANYMYMNPNPYAGFSNNFGGDYNLGVAMHVPIFHFGERKHTLAIARYENEVAVLMYNDVQNMLAIQSEQAVNQLNEAQKELETAGKSLQLAEENLRILTDAYEEGMCKSADLLEAQVMWQESYSKHLEAKAAYRKQVSNIRHVGALDHSPINSGK